MEIKKHRISKVVVIIIGVLVIIFGGISVLGHIQRGGSPTAFDRILGTRFGVKAVELVENKQFGQMVSLSGTKIVAVPLSRAVEKLKTVDMDLYDISKVFFG